jgi:uncharacterized protein (TIGR02265 family)
MPADRADLARRLTAATAADTSRGLNYNTLFTMVRDHLGEAAACQVDVLGKGQRVDFFSYPIAEYLRCAWNAVDRLEPVLGGADRVLAELGRRTVTGFIGSMLGRTALAMAGRDPRRLLGSAPSGYRGAVSYGERKVEWLGARQGRLVSRRDFMPPSFHAAVLLTGLRVTDAVDPKVAWRETGFLDAVYEFEWAQAQPQALTA